MTFDGEALRLSVLPNLSSLNEAAAEHVTILAERAIEERGRFSLVLSGGATPKPVYTKLASEPWASRIDWPRVHLFWGDERCVPKDDPESNFRMAMQALGDLVGVPSSNVHRIRGEDDPEFAASEYEGSVRAFFELSERDPPPHFDLILLGIGKDGHTASLFPKTQPLAETERWVTPNRSPDGKARVTMTFPLINAASNVTFIIAGLDKAATLQTLIQHSTDEQLPASLIRPCGRLCWMVDSDAAAMLKGRR